MDIIKITEQSMMQNSFLVVNGNDAILIDAGATTEQILENLRVFSPVPTIMAVLLTHSHFDHIRHLDSIISKFKVDAYIFESGKKMLFSETENLSIMDSPFKIKSRKNIKTFKDSDSLIFGSITVDCYNTPGHSIDSSVFVVGDSMFTGDSVFKVGVGRTDLFSGSTTMQDISLKRIADTLSVGVEHYLPGHGANFDRAELLYNISIHLGEN